MAQLTSQEIMWRQVSEDSLQEQIIECAYLNWWLHSHHPDSRLVKGPGITDLVLLRPPDVIFVEIKKEIRARWYPAQKVWRHGLRECMMVEYWNVKPSTADLLLERLAKPGVEEWWIERVRELRAQST